MPTAVEQKLKESTSEETVFRTKIQSKKYGMALMSRGPGRIRTRTSWGPSNPRASTGGTAKGVKNPSTLKVVPTTTTNDASSRPDTGRKITPKKVVKWFADETTAITEKIPAINPKESSSNPVEVTDHVSTSLSLPWNSTDIEAGQEFDQSMFNPNPDEALADDDTLTVEQKGDQDDEGC